MKDKETNREAQYKSNIITDINQIWSDKDLELFKKNSKSISWYGNYPTYLSKSDIFFHRSDHNTQYDDSENIERVIKTILERIQTINNRKDKTHIGRKGINLWYRDNVILKRYNCPAVIGYLDQKVHLDPWTFRTILFLLEKVLSVTTAVRNKTVSDLKREDFTDPKVYQKALNLLTSKMETDYYRNFLNEMSPFEKIDLGLKATRFKYSFNHPMVNYCSIQQRKKGNKEASIRNNLIEPTKRFFIWLCSVYERFKGCSINEVIVHFITEEHLKDYKLYLIRQVKEEQITENGARQHLVDVKKFFKLLYKDKKVNRDVGRTVTNLEADNYKFRKIPTDLEIQKLFNVVEIYSDDVVKERLAFSLMLVIGLRGIEVSQLRWEDVNLGTKTISLNDTKGKNCVLPLPEAICEMFKEMVVKSKGHVFSSEPKKYRIKLYQNYKLYTMIAGWKYEGGLHLLRHIFVTRLSEYCSPNLIRQLARHNSDRTTAMYIHFDNEFLKKEINKMDVHFRGDFK
ncbi:tyrosine-type recombinase/integrase [Alteribacillus sp. JSM 102045]|uniref:tyrosine-type recombinase/integrase n=1 Tax=Alteribacillus sp. JSM 102045 TaxID=1562101 RepID=UPI0035C201C4